MRSVMIPAVPPETPEIIIYSIYFHFKSYNFFKQSLICLSRFDFPTSLHLKHYLQSKHDY